MKEKYNVTGMSCAACSAAVERAVNKLPGVKSAQVNLLANSMQVEYDETVLDAAGICKAVEQAGTAQARPMQPRQKIPASRSKGRTRWLPNWQT